MMKPSKKDNSIVCNFSNRLYKEELIILGTCVHLSDNLVTWKKLAKTKFGWSGIWTNGPLDPEVVGSISNPTSAKLSLLISVISYSIS